jgi:glutamate-ammonia-ligase adenylyltransferase
MLAGSDLDLMLIYDHAPMSTAPTPWFVRLAHAFTAALTAQGAEGPLYKVDMRLRPSGNQGPVAVSLAAFKRYHAQDSWTWERLALTRARVLAATADFAIPVRAAILAALSRPDSPEKIKTDTLAMRNRLAAELPPSGPFDVKHRPGGMLELTFIAEALQLIHGPAAPALFRPNSTDALRGLAVAGHIPPATAQALVDANLLWRTVQGMNRITGLSERTAEPPAAMLSPLLRATAMADLAALLAAMETTGAQVKTAFKAIIRG